MIAFAMPDRPFVVLLAEDSEHDVRAVRRVWERNAIRNPLRIVRDGEECMEYLLQRGRYAEPETSPPPGIVLLDLNLPRMDGFEVLRRIRADPNLRRLPVVVLTTSSRDEDLSRSYDLGANAYMTKPVGLEKMHDALLKFNLFWELVRLPGGDLDGPHDHDGNGPDAGAGAS